jgi:hypothetical protein
MRTGRRQNDHGADIAHPFAAGHRNGGHDVRLRNVIRQKLLPNAFLA